MATPSDKKVYDTWMLNGGKSVRGSVKATCDVLGISKQHFYNVRLRYRPHEELEYEPSPYEHEVKEGIVRFQRTADMVFLREMLVKEPSTDESTERQTWVNDPAELSVQPSTSTSQYVPAVNVQSLRSIAGRVSTSAICVAFYFIGSMLVWYMLAGSVALLAFLPGLYLFHCASEAACAYRLIKERE